MEPRQQGVAVSASVTVCLRSWTRGDLTPVWPLPRHGDLLSPVQIRVPSSSVALNGMVRRDLGLSPLDVFEF